MNINENMYKHENLREKFTHGPGENAGRESGELGINQTISNYPGYPLTQNTVQLFQTPIAIEELLKLRDSTWIPVKYDFNLGSLIRTGDADGELFAVPYGRDFTLVPKFAGVMTDCDFEQWFGAYFVKKTFTKDYVEQMNYRKRTICKFPITRKVDLGRFGEGWSVPDPSEKGELYF